MKFFTKNLGTSRPIENQKSRAAVRRILICRPNHRLGNQLLITPLVREVQQQFPDCTIDILVKGGVATVIFQEYDQVATIIQLPKEHFKKLGSYLYTWIRLPFRKYDLTINGIGNSSSGKLLTTFSRAKYKFYGENLPEEVQRQIVDYNHTAKKPVYNLRGYLFKNTARLMQTIPALSLELTNVEIKKGRDILKEYVDLSKPVITIFTNATGNKCYDTSWWLEFHALLKAEFPAYSLFELLPVENKSQINFLEPSYYSKDIREMAAVLANCAIFIGADSGIMHLASTAQIPVIGLFKTTDPQRYEPYGNRSAGLHTANHSMTEIIQQIKQTLPGKK